VQYEEVPYTKITVTYGLAQRCELMVTEIPGPSDSGKIVYRDYECRKFPMSVTDRCDKENKAFCMAWTSAAFLNEIALGFGPISLLAILFGVSTHSRRRRIWAAVAGLVSLQGVFHRPLCFFFLCVNLFLPQSGLSDIHLWNCNRYVSHIELPILRTCAAG